MNEENVVITGIRIPFLDLVALFVKAAIAMIPALIILYLLGMLLGGIFTVIGIALS